MDLLSHSLALLLLSILVVLIKGSELGQHILVEKLNFCCLCYFSVLYHLQDKRQYFRYFFYSKLI